MKKIFKSKFGTMLVIFATVILAGITVFTAFRLYKLRQESIAPTAPESKPKAAGDKCPGAGACPYSNQLLRNCYPPDSDGTPHDSLCNISNKGRKEPCGPNHTNFCCDGTKWTTNMSSCQQINSPSPLVSTSPCDPLIFSLSGQPSPLVSISPSPLVSISPSPLVSISPSPLVSISPSPTDYYYDSGEETNTLTTSETSLPVSGTSLPTIISLGSGILLIIISFLLVL